MTQSTAMTTTHGDAAREMELEREAATRAALAKRPGFDLADLSDEEFAAGLERVEKRRHRVQALLGTVLLPKIHYGNPNGAFERPILFQDGARELRQLFRLSLQVLSVERVVTAEYCESRVQMGIVDGLGRVLNERIASCNTKEKRFRKRGGSEPTYTDAREKAHECDAMAYKRCASLLTLDATGAGPFFAAQEEMERAMEEAEEGGKPGGPWTDDERALVVATAQQVGIKTKAQMEKLLMETIGHLKPCTGKEVGLLLGRLEQLKQSGKPAAKVDPELGDAAEE